MFLENFYNKNFLNKNTLIPFLSTFFNFAGNINKKQNTIYLTFSFNKKLLPIFFYLVNFYNFGKLSEKNNQILFQIFSKKDFKFFLENMTPYLINKKFYTKVIKISYLNQPQVIFEKFILFYLLNNININVIKNFSVIDFYITFQYNTKNKISLIYLNYFLQNQFFIFWNVNYSLKILSLKKQNLVYSFLLIYYNFILKFFYFKNFLFKILLYLYIIKKYNLNLNTAYKYLFLKFKWYFLFDSKNEI